MVYCRRDPVNPMRSGDRPVVCHLRVQLEQLLQPLRIVPEASADVNALKHLVVTVVGGAEILRHAVSSVEIGDRGRKVRFPRQKDVLGGGGQVRPVLLGEHWHGEGVPAEGVRIAKVGLELATHGREVLRERWSLTLRFEFLDSIPPELVVHNRMGILVIYLQADRALVTGDER